MWTFHGFLSQGKATLNETVVEKILCNCPILMVVKHWRIRCYHVKFDSAITCLIFLLKQPKYNLIY